MYLGENYRSDYRIVQAATQVIEKNQTRYKKQLKAVSKEPGIVQMHTVKDEAEENECIIRRIREQYQAGIAYENKRCCTGQIYSRVGLPISSINIISHIR